jgi:hypothetical protein
LDIGAITTSHSIRHSRSVCFNQQAIGLNISTMCANILTVYLIYVLIALHEFPMFLGESKYDEWMSVIPAVLI